MEDNKIAERLREKNDLRVKFNNSLMKLFEIKRENFFENFEKETKPLFDKLYKEKQK